jgi:hypothetical protein
LKLLRDESIESNDIGLRGECPHFKARARMGADLAFLIHPKGHDFLCIFRQISSVALDIFVVAAVVSFWIQAVPIFP